MSSARSQRLFARYVAFAGRHTALLLGLAPRRRGRRARHVPPARAAHRHGRAAARRAPGGGGAARASPARQKSATNLVMLVRSPSAEADRAFAAGAGARAREDGPRRLLRDPVEAGDRDPRVRRALALALCRPRRPRARRGAARSRASPSGSIRWPSISRAIPTRSSSGCASRSSGSFRRAPSSEWFEGTIDRQALPRRHDVARASTAWPRAATATRSAAVRALVERTDPKRFHPQMVVEFTGRHRAGHRRAERHPRRSDARHAALLRAGAAGRSISTSVASRCLLVIGAPAVLGLLLALTLASVSIRYLNLNTAFLISIILGNGINSPIILLARYGEERRARPAGRATRCTWRMSETLRGHAHGDGRGLRSPTAASCSPASAASTSSGCSAAPACCWCG